MVKTLTAFTAEVDDPDVAVTEIKTQLDKLKLLKHSIGILSCHADCISSNVVKEVCASLSFEVVGITTLINMVPASSGEILLSLFVITSDEAQFSTGITGAFSSPDESLIAGAYNKAAANLSEKPTLILNFAPLLSNVSAEFFVDAFTKVSDGVPVFGTVAVDHTFDYKETRVIYNGQAFAANDAFIIASGLPAQFFITSISAEKSLFGTGSVTASSENQLISVNNVSVLDYFLKLGILKNDPESLNTVNSYPFIVDYGDGTTPVVRNIFAFTPEGAAVCGGTIPVGARIRVGSIDAAAVVASSEKAIKTIIKQKGINGILMYSCIGRYYAPGFAPVNEVETIRAIMAQNDISYQFTVSGGEFCPVYVNEQNDVIKNRLHNDSIVMCVF
jgi:hypothetical protein